jgi:chaperone required for assembly of F1-ATPase
MPKKIKCNCDHDLGSMPLTNVRLRAIDVHALRSRSHLDLKRFFCLMIIGNTLESKQSSPLFYDSRTLLIFKVKDVFNLTSKVDRKWGCYT